MSKIEVDAIDKQSGSTLTLGGSGTAVTLACGATQTGFGRSGSVNWDTTAKTAGFTGVNGNGYFINTTGGTITVNLPASPSAGNIIAVKDYTGTFDINTCTVARNGSNIRGATNNFTLEKANSGAVFIYVDGTEGWQVFVDGSDADAAVQYISATGGTITESGDFKIHTFTGPGTFTVNCVSCSAANNEVSYMVVAGGGGSGRSYGGGGGAGGFRERKSGVDTYTASPLNGSTPITVTATGFPITVGGGGAKATPSVKAGSGANSVFSTITSAGGGGAGSFSNPQPATGIPGGSGGGGADGPQAGGSGNTPPTTPSQGSNGGPGYNPGRAGGGGGATAVGQTGQSNAAGIGGAGATSSINGTPTARAGGGGGFGNEGGANGGAGGGGAGGNPGVAGTVNTGGGGGGSGSTPNPEMTNLGGSGIVIIRYKFQ